MSLANWQHGSTVEFTAADYYFRKGYKDYYYINCVGIVVLSHPLSRKGGASRGHALARPASPHTRRVASPATTTH